MDTCKICIVCVTKQNEDFNHKGFYVVNHKQIADFFSHLVRN